MKKVLIALTIVAIAVGAYAYRNWRLNASRNQNTIRVSGNIEVTDAEVSFKASGRVLQRAVDEGQLVHLGETIATLDSRELAQQVALQKAEVEAAQANLAELLAGSRPEEIEQGRAAVQQAKFEKDRAQADFARANDLYRQGIVAARDYEIQRAAFDVARAKLHDADQKLVLLVKGPRQEQIDAARANLEKARQVLAVSLTRFGYTTLPSPLTGIVLSKNVEPGEYVAAGTPVITVGDLQNVWLRAYVNETDLGRVKVGQPVQVTTDTYPGKVYNGRVSFISSEAEFTPKNVQTDKERVKLVYRVKIDIANPQMELKPGMPADALINLAAAGQTAAAQAALR